MTEKKMQVNEWLVEPKLGQISQGDRVVRLEPQVMKVLQYLASRAPDAVTKQQLIDDVWQRNFASDAALARCVFSLRQAFGDDPKKPRFIQTVPKIGYRMIANVSDDTASTHRGTFGRLHASVAATVVVALAFAGAQLSERPDTSATRLTIHQPTVALAETSQSNSSLLLATSALIDHRLRQKFSSISDVILVEDASDDYSLVVDARTSGNTATVDVALFDSQTDAPVLTDSFEVRQMQDLGHVDEFIGNTIDKLNIAWDAPQRGAEEAWPTQDIVAFERYQEGVERYQQFSEFQNRNAIAMFKSAITRDPDFALAHAGLAVALTMESRFWGEARYPEALASATRAMELNPHIAESHYAVGEALAWNSDTEERASVSLERALELNPNHGGALKARAKLHFRQKEYEAAIELYERAIDVDPQDYYAMRRLGWVSFYTGKLEDAYHWLRLAAQGSPLSDIGNAQLAMLEIINGDIASATARCEKVISHYASSPACLKVSAAASIMTGDLNTADEKFARLIELWPNDEYGNLGKALIMKATGDVDAADEIIDSVLTAANRKMLEDSCPIRYFRIAASANALKGDHERALELLIAGNRKGLRYDPWDQVDPLLGTLRYHDRFKKLMAATRPTYQPAKQQAGDVSFDWP